MGCSDGSGTATDTPAGGRWDRLLRGNLVDRVFSVGVLAFGAGILGIAAWLEPDPSGMGSHHQLGLGTCTFLALTGWPCPTCGMTTTFALSVRGRFLDAVANQPFGFVLFVGVVFAVVVALLDLVRPRRRWRILYAWVMEREATLAVLMLLGMGVGWIVRLGWFFHWFGGSG